MKSMLLAALLGSASIGVLAQGTVQFRNYYAGSTPPIDGRVYLVANGLIIGSPDGSDPLWRAALIGGPTTGTPASWTTAGTLQMMYNPTTTTLTWTTFRGPPPYDSGYVSVVNPPRAVPGVDWGGTALVQMVVWHGAYTSWAEAYNAAQMGTFGVYLGISNPLTLTLPVAPTSPSLTYLWGLNPVMVFLPEPSAFTLAALAAISWLMNRRKKGRASVV